MLFYLLLFFLRFFFFCTFFPSLAIILHKTLMGIRLLSLRFRKRKVQIHNLQLRGLTIQYTSIASSFPIPAVVVVFVSEIKLFSEYKTQQRVNLGKDKLILSNKLPNVFVKSESLIDKKRKTFKQEVTIYPELYVFVFR